MFNSNPIEINKSSLVSLKAEILRKQQEVCVSRLQERPKINKKISKTKKKHEDKPKEVLIDDKEDNEAILSKSRQMLESKASLYNSLSRGNLSERDLEISKRSLVQFDKKTPTDYHSEEDSDEKYDSDEYEPAKNSDDEFVEYVDFLGRTRKCLRKDLEYMKRKDSKLIDSDRKNVEEPEKVEKEIEESCEANKDKVVELSEDNELLSSDMRRELLRREWEKQEEELLNKKNIHYQDVLFSEARSHGVGYYAFSKDEELRAKQQENLKKLRQETTQQQNATAELKKIREQQLAARLKAARNRKRARMGLPPEEDEPEAKVIELKQDNEENKQNDAQKEEQERRKQEERNNFIRPWDIGKEILKKHYECNQEEWVDKQRKQRNNEFAPPVQYSTSKPQTPKEDYIENKSLYFTSKRTRNSDECSSRDKYRYGQSSNSFNRGENKFESSLEDSVLAGLKYLREQSEKRQLDSD